MIMLKTFLLLFLISVTSQHHHHCHCESPVITVQGQAFSSHPPDQVLVSFSIITLDMSANKSLEQNSNTLQNSISSLNGLGFTNEEISTSGFSLSPHYEYNSTLNKQIFLGYQTTNSLLVTTKKIDSAGSIIDSAVKAGVTNVNSVDFQISPKVLKELKDKLIATATKDAQNKANLALEPLGAKISGVKSVRLQQSVNNIPYMAKYAMDSSSNAGTAIFAKNQEFNVFVDVDFFIKNRPEKFHWEINKLGNN